MFGEVSVSPLVAAAVGGALFLYILAGLVQIKAWEVGLKFTFGKYSGKLQPGLNWYPRVLQRVRRVDVRICNRDLFQQAVITKDNITLHVDAVVYFRVADAEKAVLAVEDFEAAVRDRAKVVLRDIIGEVPLDQLLAHREEISAKVREHVESVVSQWGLHVDMIGLQDIQVPAGMVEVLAKAAIADRERQYVVTKSLADLDSAKNFAMAARMLSAVPGAMELRRFEMLSTLSQSGTTKVVFDLTKPFEDVHKQALGLALVGGDVPASGNVGEPTAVVDGHLHRSPS